MSDDSLEKTLDYLRDLNRWRASDRRPRLIALYLAAPGLADFIRRSAVAAHLLRGFAASRVYAIHHEDAPEHRFLVDCNPWIDFEIQAPANAPATLPLDWFDIGAAAPVKCPDPAWAENRLNWPDLMLTPPMLDVDPARLEGLAETPPALRLPPSRAESLNAALETSGLARECWFAAVSLEGAAAAMRDPLGALIEARGGQMLDLATPALAGTAWLAAVARARLVVASGDAALAAASAFATPALAVGLEAYAGTPWNQGDRIVRSSMAEPALTALEAMLDASTGITAWRDTPPPKPAAPAEALVLPLPLRAKPLVTFAD